MRIGGCRVVCTTLLSRTRATGDDACCCTYAGTMPGIVVGDAADDRASGGTTRGACNALTATYRRPGLLGRYGLRGGVALRPCKASIFIGGLLIGILALRWVSGRQLLGAYGQRRAAG